MPLPSFSSISPFFFVKMVLASVFSLVIKYIIFLDFLLLYSHLSKKEVLAPSNNVASVFLAILLWLFFLGKTQVKTGFPALLLGFFVAETTVIISLFHCWLILKDTLTLDDMRSAIIECTTDPGFLLKIRGKYLFEPMVLHADLNISVFTDPVMNEKRRYTAQ